ncbi:probable serine/threonine-protein kinase vps15 [Palaemon carinicauda]|uniref:probable serine/threonine-protein kinase vps15 n=1 Tax=Palaemon carinicauda TaxID=392227 RepID=UPI0035B5C600
MTHNAEYGTREDEHCWHRAIRAIHGDTSPYDTPLYMGSHRSGQVVTSQLCSYTKLDRGWRTAAPSLYISAECKHSDACCHIFHREVLEEGGNEGSDLTLRDPSQILGQFRHSYQQPPPISTTTITSTEMKVLVVAMLVVLAAAQQKRSADPGIGIGGLGSLGGLGGGLGGIGHGLAGGLGGLGGGLGGLGGGLGGLGAGLGGGLGGLGAGLGGLGGLGGGLGHGIGLGAGLGGLGGFGR